MFGVTKPRRREDIAEEVRIDRPAIFASVAQSRLLHSPLHLFLRHGGPRLVREHRARILYSQNQNRAPRIHELFRNSNQGLRQDSHHLPALVSSSSKLNCNRGIDGSLSISSWAHGGISIRGTEITGPRHKFGFLPPSRSMGRSERSGLTRSSQRFSFAPCQRDQV